MLPSSAWRVLIALSTVGDEGGGVDADNWQPAMLAMSNTNARKMITRLAFMYSSLEIHLLYRQIWQRKFQFFRF
jgi:hypothetical protein